MCMGRVGLDFFGPDVSSTTESHVNLISYSEDRRLPPEMFTLWTCLVLLSCSLQHVPLSSYSYSAAASASSSTPHCGAHSSSGAKAICPCSNLFFKNDDDNNNNKYTFFQLIVAALVHACILLLIRRHIKSLKLGHRKSDVNTYKCFPA